MLSGKKGYNNASVSFVNSTWCYRDVTASTCCLPVFTCVYLCLPVFTCVWLVFAQDGGSGYPDDLHITQTW